MPTGASSLAGSDEFIMTAARIWKLIKEVKEKSEPLSQFKDSLELANNTEQFSAALVWISDCRRRSCMKIVSNWREQGGWCTMCAVFGPRRRFRLM
jgi:hypothetical protein